jgi:hypothetical protein
MTMQVDAYIGDMTARHRDLNIDFVAHPLAKEGNNYITKRVSSFADTAVHSDPAIAFSGLHRLCTRIAQFAVRCAGRCLLCVPAYRHSW